MLLLRLHVAAAVACFVAHSFLCCIHSVKIFFLNTRPVVLPPWFLYSPVVLCRPKVPDFAPTPAPLRTVGNFTAISAACVHCQLFFCRFSSQVSVSASYPWCFSVFLSFFYASALSLNVARIKRNESWELRFMLHYVAAVSGVAVVAGVAGVAVVAGISQLSCGAFSHTPNRILAACCCWCCCLGMATQKLRHFINCALFAAKKKGQPLTCCALLCDSPWQLTETLAHQHRPRPTATSHCHCRTAHQQHHHLVAVGHQGGFIWLPKTKREILLQSPQSPHLQVAGFFLGSVLGATPQCCEHHFASYLCSLDLKKI